MQLEITHDDGSTDTINQTLGWTRTRELGAMRRARIDVERSAAEAANLQPKQDTVALGSIDTLRLVDLETGGSTWTLVCYSFEWNANRVEPTAGGNLRQGTDQQLINGLISEVPDWTAGNINSFTNGMEFVLSHAHRHEALRRIERNVPGELQWRDEGTVDYVDSLGTDRTGSVTISAANGNIEGDIQITKRGRELDGTHFRILGAHEGEAQIAANLVPSDDSATYENRVNYTTSRWADGDPRDWDRWSNKDVMSQSTIEEEAAALGAELEDPLVEAKATVYGEDLNVGDTVRVVKQDADLDRHMRVHRIKTISDAAKRVYECLFSTRTTVRKGDSHDLEDITRYNTAFQGASVSVQGGGSRQPIDNGVNAEIPFDYPEIEYENEATLQVRGLPYRAYSSGAAAGGGEFISETTDADGAIFATTDDNADFTNVADAQSDRISVSLNGDTLVDSFSPNASTSLTLVRVAFGPDAPPSDEVVNYTWRLEESGSVIDEVETTAGAPTTDTNPYTFTMLADFNDREFDTLDLYVNGEGDLSTFASVEWISAGPHNHLIDVSDHTHPFEVDIPDHVHDPNPGVIEFFSETPSNVDVIVNGTTVATDIGSGTFETEVDLSGELDQGAWNLVELTSDTLGHVMGTLSLDGYKQIGKSN